MEDLTYSVPPGIDKPTELNQENVADILREHSSSPMEIAQQLKSRPNPNPADLVKRNQPKAIPRRNGADHYLEQAKALVVENYNAHRNPMRSPKLSMDLVYVSSSSKMLGSWKVIVASTEVRGLLWEVSFNSDKGKIYLDIFHKIFHLEIPIDKKDAP